MIVDLVLQPVAWVERARCRGHPNPDLWFPEPGGRTTQARAVCGECPVTVECLAFAFEDEDAFAFGAWGGTSPKERRLLQRGRMKRRRTAA